MEAVLAPLGMTTTPALTPISEMVAPDEKGEMLHVIVAVPKDPVRVIFRLTEEASSNSATETCRLQQCDI